MIQSIKKMYAVVAKTFAKNKKCLTVGLNHWPVALQVNGC